MATIDVSDETRLEVVAQKQAYTSDPTTAVVDLNNFESALIVIDAGSYTDGTHAFSVDESDQSGSGFSSVDGNQLSQSPPTIDGAADDDQQYYIGYTGDQRYIDVNVSVSGTSTGAIYGIYVIKGDPHRAPLSV